MKFRLVEKLFEDVINEAKQDEINFREFVGDDKLVDLFISLKKNFKSPYNDFYYWIKKGKAGNKEEVVAELKDYVEENKPKKDKFASEEEEVAAMPAASSGAKKIAEQDGYEVYHITTPEASVKYGLLVGGRAKWCISGGYYDGKQDNGVLGEAKKYFNDYINRDFEDIFFVIGHGTKYALCIESYDPLKYQIWNQADSQVKEIPELNDLYWDDET